MTKELVYQLHDFLSKKVGELLFRRLVIKMCKSARNFHLVGCKWRKPRFSAFFDVFPFMRPSDATHTQRWQRQTKKKWRVSQNIILLWPSSGEQSNSYLSGQALFLSKILKFKFFLAKVGNTTKVESLLRDSSLEWNSLAFLTLTPANTNWNICMSSAFYSGS